MAETFVFCFMCIHYDSSSFSLAAKLELSELIICEYLFTIII